MVSLIFRLLHFGTTRGLADHNLLLMKGGAEHRARAIFAEVAREAIKKKKLYEDAIDNKTLEAQNALLFAGRVALFEGRSAAAVMLFRTAKNLREDADARLLIGKQMSGAGALDGAMIEYKAVLGASEAEAPPSTRSEAHRCIAEVYVKRGLRGKARTSLGDAQRIDQEQQDYTGLARTLELIGDLYRPRADVRNAALNAYTKSAENYDRADLPAQARSVRGKYARLNSGGIDKPGGWWTRTLERCARWILRQVEKRRVREHTRAA
jgi:tetratricopeptide (TPR) repeat protein